MLLPLQPQRPMLLLNLPANQLLAAARVDLDTGIDLELRPDIHGTDGFYAAVMERRGANSAATQPETVDEA